MQCPTVETGVKFQPEEVAAIGCADAHFIRKEAQQGGPHLLLALGQGVAQTAKVGIYPALAQHLGQCQLAWHIGRQGRHQLQPLNALGMGPRHHPADSKARGQAFGKRAAQQAVAPHIPALERFGPFTAKVEIGVDVVLHQWHLMLAQQLHQRLLVAVWHCVAQGVLHIAHQPARFDGALGQRFGQQGEIDAPPGITGISTALSFSRSMACRAP